MSDFTGRKIINSYFLRNLLFKTHYSTAPFVELTIIDRLRIALTNLERIPGHKISSPPHQQRRASVAIIIRIRPNPSHPINLLTKPVDKIPGLSSPLETSEISNLENFWKLPWVSNGVPEILYIKRALRDGDRWSGQMAFPGGKQDPEDVDDLDTAEREAFEEVGFDLGNNEQFMCVGALDDLEVTTTFGKKLLMILCPFVFLQLTRESPPIEISGSEIASTHWVPISIFFNSRITQRRNPISVDLSSRLAPKSWLLQNILKTLIGRMHFHCIDIPQLDSNQYLSSLSQETAQGMPASTLRLWGLTLQMTSDLMDMMYKPEEEPPRRLDALRPKFDYWDVNFFIWWFLKSNRVQYRRQKADFANRRTKWASGWVDYHKAVQKSVIIAAITRTLFGIWILYKLPRIMRYLMNTAKFTGEIGREGLVL